MRSRVTATEAGGRLDLWLVARHPEVSRSQIGRWIERGAVTVDGRPVKAGHALRPGEVIEWQPPAPEVAPSGRPPAESIPLSVVYEDDHLLVIDKPAGMVVHPGAGVRSGTLVSALLGRGTSLASLGGPTRPGIVHRLDRGTSGLLVVARTDAAYSGLVRAIAARTVHRVYRALVWGLIPGTGGEIEGQIARSRADRRRMTVVRQGGRPSLTRYRVRGGYRFVTDLDLELETGRTHQIRVHWRHRGHPVFGDPDYGGRSRRMLATARDRELAREWLALIDRQALHAARLSFDHPVTGERVGCESPLPPDMARLYEAVEAST